MSIIVTQINKFGIIFGSDSNITSKNKVERPGKKIFEISKLSAAMCIAGAYTVGGEMMDEWLPMFITKNQSNYKTLEEFTYLLSEEFNLKMLPEEKRHLSIAHVAGYVNGHPEMWCLSNTTLGNNGYYTEGAEKFHCSEDLWNRDYKDNNLETLLASDGFNYQMYVNSSTQGRVAFNVVRNQLDYYYISMFNAEEFKYRSPRNLEEHRLIVKTYIDMIDVIYKLSDYEPKEIGGETQIYVIPKPNYLEIK